MNFHDVRSKGGPAAKAARAARHSALLGVAEGVITVGDVLDEAGNDTHRPLLKMRLRDLLAAQPEWTQGRADRTVADFTRGRRLKDPQNVKVAWVLKQPQRVAQLVEMCALNKTVQPPTTGWPYA